MFLDLGAVSSGRSVSHAARQARAEQSFSLDPGAGVARAAVPTADSLEALASVFVGIRPVTRTVSVTTTPAPTADPTAAAAADPMELFATPAPDPATVSTGEDDVIGEIDDRLATVYFGTMEPLRVNGLPATPFDGNGFANYVVAFADHLDGGGTQSSLVWDANTMTLLPGGAGDWPELGTGDGDTLELSGDFSAGFGLPGQPAGLDRVVLRPGDDYNLTTTDDHVGVGATLTIDAMPLGQDNHVMFDGSAETDGRFVFFGSGDGDFFFGGAGDDRIVGLGGGDTLSGGGGSDIFVYSAAADSTGTDYDTIADFDPATDRIDLPGGVTGFGTAIEGGTLSTATFNEDLAAAAADLGAAQAVWFAPDAGDLAGQIFLIVDGNDQPGYQAGEDFVFAIGGAPLTDLTGHTDIFI